MQPLNAIDAINPAFTRTHELLFAKPWKLGRVWKLCATQYLGALGSVFIPLPLFLFLLPSGTLLPPHFRGVALLLATLGTLVILGFVYIGVRLEFVGLEMIVTRERFVAPMWRRYGRRTWPVVGVKVFIGTVVSLLMLPLLVHIFRGFFGVMASMPAGQKNDPALAGQFFQQVLGFEAIFLLYFLLLKLPSTLLQDFAQPFYTLEQVTLMTAIRRGCALLLADPLASLGFLIMKFIFFILGLILAEIAYLISLIPVGIGFVIVIALGALLGVHSSGSASLLLVAAGGVLYVAFFAYCMFSILGFLGYVYTVLEAYGTYFVGSRYPMLGNLLEPPTPNYIYSPPPTAPPPGEDDDSGPSLPMDPALA